MKKIKLYIAPLMFVILSLLVLNGCYTQLAIVDDEPAYVSSPRPIIIIIDPPPPYPCPDCGGPPVVDPIGPIHPIYPHPRPPLVHPQPVSTTPTITPNPPSRSDRDFGNQRPSSNQNNQTPRPNPGTGSEGSHRPVR